MPGRLILEINSTQIFVPVKGTAQQIRATVRRFAKSQNVMMEGKTDTEIGEAALRRVLRWMRHSSLDEQRRELIEAKMAEIDAILNSDNDLYDEPEPPPQELPSG